MYMSRIKMTYPTIFISGRVGKIMIWIGALCTIVDGGLLSKLPKTDVYSGRHLCKGHFSREHIVPRRFFVNKKHADDPINIVPGDRHINSVRSDYRFGFPHKNNIHDQDSVQVMNHKCEICGYINKRRRTFYPVERADVGILGRSITTMLEKYPYLYNHLLEIVDDPKTLHRWSCEPMSYFEQQRLDMIDLKTMV